MIKDTINNKEIFRTNIEVGSSEINIPTLRANVEYTIQFIKSSNLSESDDVLRTTTLEQSILGNVDYELSIGNLEFNRGTVYYNSNSFNKGDVVPLRFKNTNILCDNITSVFVSNKWIDVKLSDTYYTLDYTTPNDAGNYIINLTKIRLDDDTEIELENNKTLEVNIIKSNPNVSDINIIGTQDYRANVIFKLTDDDNTISESVKPKLLLIKDNKIVYECNIKVGENIIDVDLLPSTEYTLEVRADYQNGNGVIYRDIILKSKVFKSPYSKLNYHEISNLSVTNINGQIANIFGLNTNMIVSFDITDRKLNVTKVIIDGEEYPAITKDNRVIVNMTAPNNMYNRSYTIEKLIDIDNHEVQVGGDRVFIAFVTKNKPYVSSFSSSKVSDTELRIDTVVEDPDSAINGTITLAMYDGDRCIKQVAMLKGSDTKVFDISPGREYRFEVILESYSLSTEHSYTDDTIYTKSVHVNSDELDLKDIKSFKLYRNGVAVDNVNISNGIPEDEELSEYYLEIDPVYTPKLYTNVKEFKMDNDSKLNVVADLDNFVTFYKDSSNQLQQTNDVAFEIPYTNGGSTNSMKSASEFIAEITANMSGTIELEENVDASTLDATNPLVSGTFKGTINGNGYAIYNLKTSLFTNLDGAKINNLKIIDANIEGNRYGILASNTLTNQTVIDGVTFENCSLITNTNSVGLVGYSITNSTIKNTKVLDCTIKGTNTPGGLIGQVSGGGLVQDCFVRATVTGTQAHANLGSRAGGIAGWLSEGGTIERCYADVTVNGNGTAGNGGIFGGPKDTGKAGTIKNCFVTSSGNAMQIAGFNSGFNESRTEKIYQLSKNKNLNATIEGKIITVDTLTETLFKDTLGLRSDYWDLIAKKDNLISENSALNKLPGYSSQNEVAYFNIMKIAPFLSSESIINMGNLITDDNMRTKEIIGVYPFDANGNFVEYVESNNTQKIKTIKIVYKDETYKVYNVKPLKVSDNLVDMYSIVGETIPYHFDKYIMSDLGNITEYVKSTASGFDYTTDIQTAGGTTNEIYLDIYNNQIKNSLDKFAKQLVYNEYPYTINNEHLIADIKSKVTDGLQKKIFAYTYLRRGFNFDIGGIDIADLIFFNSEKLASGFTNTDVINGISSASKDANRTHETYNSIVLKRTGIELYDQLELFIRLTGTDNYNEWLVNNWNGYIKEQEPIGYTPTPLLKWRAWDNLTNAEGLNNLILNVLSVPKNRQQELGIISTGGQILFTDINLYYNDVNDNNIQSFKNKIDSIARYYGLYVGSTLNYIVNGEQNLNNDMGVSIDTLLSNKWANPTYKNIDARVSDAALAKYIAKPLNKIYTAQVGAACDGKYTFYGWMSALAYESFMTFTHENAHGQDTTYFFNNAGRRFGSNGEHFASGLFAEPSLLSAGNGDITINRINNFKITDDVVCPFDYERVNTQLELQDFYRKLYDSSYAINGIMANAALRLNNDQIQKAFVWTRVNPDNVEKPRAMEVQYTYANTYFNPRTFEQLYDSRLNYRFLGSGGQSYTEVNFWEVNWYTPENPDGISDATTFKNLAHELLGYYGWDKGLVGWSSDRYANDVEAIQNITGYNSMRDYKLAKFNEAESKKNTIPYFDSERMEALFYETYTTFHTENPRKRAFTEPGMWARKAIISAIKRVTNDFTDGDMYNEPSTIYHVGTASDLVSIINANAGVKGLYIKLTSDIDMSEIANNNKDFYAEQFIGILDGQNYKIKGLTKPLLNSTRFAVIQNVEFEGTTNSVLAKTGYCSLVYDCRKSGDKSLYTTGGWEKEQLITYLITEPVSISQ